MRTEGVGLVVWDVDGTLVPADLRWLRRAVARTYRITESAVEFPAAKVHGYTDEAIVIDTAVCSGVPRSTAETGVSRFHRVLAEVMSEGWDELARVQPAYPGARESLEALHRAGFRQTVLTGNLRSAADIKLAAAGLRQYLDLEIGGFGSDARDRFALPAVIGRRFRAVYGHPLEPSSAVVIGDAPNDVACARHAGFHVAVVTHRTTWDELAQHRPDVILEDLTPSKVIAAVTSLTATP
ncbi:HAD family hydrolase [Actinoplanes sp. NPDC049668]|uniref:HAD family hydrolase n=1 Tax=unclassified Actinoplanes TaxID=2626549 RepID=UPI0033BF12CA